MPEMSNMLAELKYSEEEFPSIIVNDGTVTSLDQATRWVSDYLEAL